MNFMRRHLPDWLCRRSYMLFEADGLGLEVVGRKIAETTRIRPHPAAVAPNDAVQAAFYSLLRRRDGYVLHLRAAWDRQAPRPPRLLDPVPGQPGVFGKIALFDAPDYLIGFFAAAGLPAADLADLLAAAARRDGRCRSLLRRLRRERPDLARAGTPPREYDARPAEDRWPACKPQARLAVSAPAGLARLGPLLALLGLGLAVVLTHLLLWQDPVALTGKLLVEDLLLTDKLAHLLMAFALTASLCAWSRDPLLALPAAGMVMLLGLGLEFFQERILDGFVSSRDIVANDLGSACALLARFALAPLRT